MNYNRRAATPGNAHAGRIRFPRGETADLPE